MNHGVPLDLRCLALSGSEVPAADVSKGDGGGAQICHLAGAAAAWRRIRCTLDGPSFFDEVTAIGV